MDEMTDAAPLPSSHSVQSPAFIRHNWTLTSGGQYVFGTASLDRILQPQDLQCLDNPGGGNCAWYALLDSWKLRFSNQRALCNFVYEYARQHPDETDIVANFLQIP
jgi:hypothetical protein